MQPVGDLDYAIRCRQAIVEHAVIQPERQAIIPLSTLNHFGGRSQRSRMSERLLENINTQLVQEGLYLVQVSFDLYYLIDLQHIAKGRVWTYGCDAQQTDYVAEQSYQLGRRGKA